jgi:predicted ATPase
MEFDNRSVLFNTRSMGSDKSGYVGYASVSKAIGGEALATFLERKFHSSHGQSIASDIVEFLLMTKNEDVIFFDEPETALDLNAKNEILKIFNRDKKFRPIIIATNCPFFILKSDVIFELTKKECRKISAIERVVLKNNIIKMID